MIKTNHIQYKILLKIIVFVINEEKNGYHITYFIDKNINIYNDFYYLPFS